jgi:hypothetical protein
MASYDQLFSYATDGKCHNSEPGTYNHECGRPAVWIGENAKGFRSGFCDDCRHHGHEAKRVQRWTRMTAGPMDYPARDPVALTALAAEHVRLSPEELDALAVELACCTGFADLLATESWYRPTMRVDLDPRYACLAAAFNRGVELLGQDRRAWTPAYDDDQVRSLAAYGLKPA